MPRGLVEGRPDVGLLGVVRGCRPQHGGYDRWRVKGLCRFCVWVGERGFAEEPKADVAGDDCHQQERKNKTLGRIVSVIIQDSKGVCCLPKFCMSGRQQTRS
jgi:hypothetical protein